MFGWKPRLLIDLILEPTHKTTQKTHAKFVDGWKSQMNQAYKIASTNSSYRKRKDIARHRYDNEGPLTAVLEKGDRVLIRNLPERGRTGKMKSFWEEKEHVVIENLNSENITYKVQPDLSGKIRTLHRNMLLPCNNLLDNFDWNIIGEHHNSNHKIKEGIKSKDSDTHTEIKDRVNSMTPNGSQRNRKNEVAYSDAETESSTENEALEFTPKELQCLDQGRTKRELERDNRNEESE